MKDAGGTEWLLTAGAAIGSAGGDCDCQEDWCPVDGIRS